MGKMIPMLILIFALELGMILFFQVTIPGTSLYTIIADPAEWSSGTLGAFLLSDILLAVGAIGIVAGLYFVRNDWIVYASVSAVFFSFGLVIVQAWQELAGTEMLGDAVSAGFIMSMLLGGLIIAFLISVMDYARGRD